MVSSIRSRILSAFVITSVLISLLFSALTLLYSYSVEDSFFRFILDTERSTVTAQLARGKTPKPGFEFVSYYPDIEQLPDAVRLVLIEEQQRIEFPGPNGEHYHLMSLSSGFLLAEVSEQLILRKTKAGLANISLVLLGIILLLVIGTSWLLARRITRPIKQLSGLIDQAHSNQLPHGFSSQFKQDEIGRFATTLDNAFSRINRFIEREQHFTRDASHELRTPIAISTGAVTLLKDSQLDAEQVELVERIALAQQDMQQSIDSLLALAREESLKQSDIALLPLVETSILMHHKLIEHKAIELTLDISPKANVYSNPQALKVILSNLVSNAFKHTQQGDIHIRVKGNTLSLSNSGAELPQHVVDSLFKQGIKGEHSTGMGFGLSIVKRLCDRLNITLTVTQQQNNWRFNLVFPQAD